MLLLRIIPGSNEKGEQIIKHYETLLYFPLRKHFFDTVEIELCSASGEKIVFSGGKQLSVYRFNVNLSYKYDERLKSISFHFSCSPRNNVSLS